MELQTLAQMVANALTKLTAPDVWEYEQPQGEWATDKWHIELWAHIQGPNGAKLSLHKDTHKNRLSISGDYPRSGGNIYPYSGRPDSITVSFDREPFAIAKEIDRRYLPVYLEAYTKGKEQYDRHVAHDKATDELVYRMCSYVGKEVRKGYHDGKVDRNYYIDTAMGGNSVTMEVRGPDDVKLDFSCSEEVAKKVFDLLGVKIPADE